MKLIDNVMTINAEELLNNPNATIIDTKEHNSTKEEKDTKEIKIIINENNNINIVNADVVYTKNPEEVTNMINQYGEDYACGNEDKNRRNDKIIKEQIEKNDVIIFACGKGDIKNYESRIEHLKKILKNSKKTIYSVGKLTKDGFPRHMSRIDYKFDLKEMQV